ncbi:hypothetical protein [Larkinella sp. C7]|uniref:hypothetical protein n=1 Tax=Larkinella sp. C7 TaxID=2576607 RepID=UPI001111033A|nr:hypothetical protein [Larkinella sp. C7]
MSNLKTITYDLGIDNVPPIPGEYLVSVGKRGIGSVWYIKEVRKVNSKVVRDYTRYALKVIHTPEMKEFTVLEGDMYESWVWVRGQEAHPCVWYPRGKKL